MYIDFGREYTSETGYDYHYLYLINEVMIIIINNHRKINSNT